MKSIKNSIYATLDVVFAPFFLVIATPIFISQIGIEKYGLWILVNSVLASLSIFNFGINETIIKYISESKSKNDNLFQSKVFSSVILFLVLLSVIILGAIYLVFFSNYFLNFFKVTEIIKILLFAFPLFFIKQIEQALFALHKSHEDFKHLAKQSFISKALLYLSQIIAVFVFKDVKSVFMISVIVAGLYLLYQFYELTHKYESVFVRKNASVSVFKGILGYGKWAWFSSTILIFSAHIDKWIVSSLLGLKIFAYYSIGVSVLNQLKTIHTASISWVFPKISGNQLSVSERANLHFKLTVFVSVLGLMVSFFLVKTDFLFKLWLGDFTFQNSKLYLHTFLYLLPIWLMSAASFYYLQGLAIVKKKFFADSLVLILKIVVTFVALLKLDIERWPILFFIPMLVEVILFSSIVNKHSKLKMTHLNLFIVFNFLILFLRYKGIL
ncbi:oligosaccharide flippase family protein [Olleya sp. YS]|uniref:oligosaccharide flippase family protein n=1 Tax=Olleya sp. YS TaxID=3028318 RepID=UPI00243414DA|nr:oligosaccharide flippase family protein [Olleya sp. YS]WGD35771.1 oligosaccharide flippase family protein [Olleya sp. YS]